MSERSPADSSSATSVPRILFGIGCFSFEAPDADLLLMANSSGQYTIHDWADDVEKALKSIPSLDDIVVEGFRYVRGDHPKTWRDSTTVQVQDLPRTGLHRGGELRPHPSSGRISFTVTIPLHVQKEVFAYAGERSGTRFGVDIHFSNGMPVAFVHSFTDESDPALGVAIVREFLRHEFAQRVEANSPIRFTGSS